METCNINQSKYATINIDHE